MGVSFALDVFRQPVKSAHALNTISIIGALGWRIIEPTDWLFYTTRTGMGAKANTKRRVKPRFLAWSGVMWKRIPDLKASK